MAQYESPPPSRDMTQVDSVSAVLDLVEEAKSSGKKHNMHGRNRRKKLNREEEEELESAFHVFATDKKGKIKYRELKAVMRALGFQAKKAEVKDLFQMYERDEEEGLEFFEFREIMMDKILERDPVEEYRKAFSLFDKDKSGKISLRDMRLLARQIGEKVSDEVLIEMIDEFDEDGDGEIDEREFLRIMDNNNEDEY